MLPITTVILASLYICYYMITHYYICSYIIITYYYQVLLPIIMEKMGSLLPIITRSIMGNNGFISTYY